MISQMIISKLLTSEEIKQMLQKKIEEKEKEVRPDYLTRGMQKRLIRNWRHCKVF